MIYVTGDIHGSNSINKLSFKNFPQGRTLTKQDYIIICGDFGLLFYNNQTNDERYHLKWLNDRPWTTLWVDGNHENHPMILSGIISSELNESMNHDRYQIVNKFGGVVGQIADSVFHLRRGEIYSIDDSTIFTMGGALSIDKANRRDGYSWWKEEEPNYKEYNYALENLEKHGNKVDYIFTHTMPKKIFEEFCTRTKTPMWNDKIDSVTRFLDEVINIVEFKKLFCGHFHIDFTIDKFHFLYDDIIPVEGE